MPNVILRGLLGPQNAPTVLLHGSPSILWPLVILAIWRTGYGLDALIHGSPQALAAGGRMFSNWYAAVFLLVSVWGLVGLLVTVGTGRTRQEFLSTLAILGGYATLAGAVVWNSTHGLPGQGLVPLWQALGLATLPAWRLLNIAASYRPLKGGPHRLKWAGR